MIVLGREFKRSAAGYARVFAASHSRAIGDAPFTRSDLRGFFFGTGQPVEARGFVDRVLRAGRKAGLWSHRNRQWVWTS